MTIATVWMILSGMLGALSNFCMRKSMEKKGSARTFFLFQLVCTFLTLIYLYPVAEECYSINLYTICMACACGFFLALLKLQVVRALKAGPASLTFACINCASIAPAIAFALLFVDCTYTFGNLIGSTLVAIGLFWAINNQSQFTHKWGWIAFAMLAFFVHTLFLILTEWHAILLRSPHWLNDFWLYGSDRLHSAWFAPLVFATAALIHSVLYWFQERRFPRREEFFWGILGGLLNGACSYFFQQSVLLATGIEQACLFPLFSVTLILVCNLWGQWLYGEEVHWKANCLCLAGLFVPVVV